MMKLNKKRDLLLINVDLSIVIPCFNEDKNILLLNDKILSVSNKLNNIEIIFVNNGSTDNTEKHLNFLSDKYNFIKVINLSKNIGYGGGILKGCEISIGNYICWTHADLQTDLFDVVDCFKIIKDNKNKKLTIKGKRINRPFIDVFFTKSMSILCYFIFGYDLDDINGQPKIFERKLFNKFNEPPNDFSLDLYLLLISYKYGYKIECKDVNFKNRFYGKAKGGGGTISDKFKITYRSLKFIINTYKNKKIWK